MHDVAWAEKSGIPSVAILSDAFVPQSAYQSESLGQKDLARLVVQHPIQDCSQEEIFQRADRVYGSLVRALTTDGPHVPPEGAEGAAACSS